MIGSVEVQRGTLHGKIDSETRLVGATVNSEISLVGIAGIPSLAPIDAYEGSYEILPTVEVQTMDTAGKRMIEDVQILAIPLYEVSNECGCTLIIGG